MEDETPNLQEMLKEMRENLDAIVQSQASWALIMKAKYDALTEVSFTPEQAIEILKARGILM